jgi:nucleotide-binding universal stress UspA family protein
MNKYVPRSPKYYKMKKILIACDGRHFPEGAFHLAEKLNELSPVLLTGVFLSYIDYTSVWSYYGIVSGGPVVIPAWDEADSELMHKNILRFKERCEKNGIEYRVHDDTYHFALPELKKETRFADLLLLSATLFYENLDDSQPNDYLKDTLHDGECPVILVPEEFEFPEHLIIAYDGSESAVYAIKQFACTFPELCHLETTLVYASEDKEEAIPDLAYIEELAARHFSNLTLFKLDIDPQKHFNIWLSEKRNTLLVTGAFGRSGLSRSLRKSFITDIIRNHRLPVFVAHR